MCLLLISSIYLNFKYHNLENMAKTITDRYLSIKVKDERMSNKLKKYALIQQSMENVDIPNFVIKDGSNKSIILSELTNNKDDAILCFRFKEYHCDACVQYIIRLLDDISEVIPEKIVILCGYSNFNQFAAFESCKNKNIAVYNIGDIPEWKVDNIEQSYFFILYQGKICNVFIPLKEDSDYMQKYIHTLLYKYWGEHSCTENYLSSELR